MNENKFETDDFERVLKEHADQFFLIPSERIWKSIYNDLHPGSKWPSLAVGLFMLLTLFWVGNTNRNNNEQLAISQKSLRSEKASEGNEAVQSVILGQNENASLQRGIPEQTEGRLTQPPQIAFSDNNEVSLSIDQKATDVRSNIMERVAKNKVKENDLSSGTQQPSTGVLVSTKHLFKDLPGRNSVESNDQKVHSEVVPEKIVSQVLENNPTEVKIERESTRFNIKRPKKLQWEYFVTPMISSVNFGGLNLNKSNSGVVNSPVSKHDMNIAKRLGFITGANAYYPITKRLSLTSGAHLVYTGYNIYTNTMRPDYTSLTFRDSKGQLFSKNYVSYYGNDKKESNFSITNYNFQFSVPVGIQWDLVSNDNFKISVISTIEPFMVLGSKAYLLSGDASSYVTDPDIIRKLNVSGNIGSVITFSSNTVKWKIGPNFRYQVLSTYNNIYPVKEHFVNYGLHIGVSKKD